MKKLKLLKLDLVNLTLIHRILNLEDEIQIFEIENEKLKMKNKILNLKFENLKIRKSLKMKTENSRNEKSEIRKRNSKIRK